jgi:GT2 family glycosyltransferase
MVDISVIIVNYKSAAKTLNCIRAVKKSDTAGLEIEIIVVDNASGDEIESEIKKNFFGVILIKSDTNVGMGAGNNLGIKAANGEFVLVLNPDTYLDEQAIKIMIGYTRINPAVGIIGPKLLYPDGSLQFTCHRFPKIYMPLLRRTFLGRFARDKVDRFLMKDYDHLKPREADWLQGSCLFIRKTMLDKIGSFDEKFFMYFEDTDLCRRAHKNGYKVVYLPQAIGIHDHTRASAADHWYIAPFTNKLARAHIVSWVKYFWKWGVIGKNQ